MKIGLQQKKKLNDISGCTTYIEPFSGGAGAALNLLFLEKVDSIVINDFDKAIFPFWKSTIDDTYNFIDKINSTEITTDEWDRQKEKWLINARFNKQRLINRIKNIASYKSRVMIFNKDGIDLLRNIAIDNSHFIYLDPPYYVKGSSLYLNRYIQEKPH